MNFLGIRFFRDRFFYLFIYSIMESHPFQCVYNIIAVTLLDHKYWKLLKTWIQLLFRNLYALLLFSPFSFWSVMYFCLLSTHRIECKKYCTTLGTPVHIQPGVAMRLGETKMKDKCSAYAMAGQSILRLLTSTRGELTVEYPIRIQKAYQHCIIPISYLPLATCLLWSIVKQFSFVLKSYHKKKIYIYISLQNPWIFPICICLCVIEKFILYPEDWKSRSSCSSSPIRCIWC